jgi:forespore regulator of the sigma-K checkpoint
MRVDRAALLKYVISMIAIVLFMLPDGLLMSTVHAENTHKIVHPQQDSKAIQLELILQKVYLDGEISEETLLEKVHSMDVFWAKYDQWQTMDIGETKIVLRRNVDDISPLLKANGYFGITSDGTLTIFNGRPQKYNIIQSFFQIDIKKLESNKQIEILKGIPIKTKDQYVEVLETFKNYSVDERIQK